MRRYHSQLAAGALMVCLVGSVNAAAPNSDAFERYLTSKAYLDRLFELGLYWDRDILERQTRCETHIRSNQPALPFLIRLCSRMGR